MYYYICRKVRPPPAAAGLVLGAGFRRAGGSTEDCAPFAACPGVLLFCLPVRSAPGYFFFLFYILYINILYVFIYFNAVRSVAAYIRRELHGAILLCLYICMRPSTANTQKQKIFAFFSCFPLPKHAKCAIITVSRGERKSPAGGTSRRGGWREKHVY